MFSTFREVSPRFREVSSTFRKVLSRFLEAASRIYQSLGEVSRGFIHIPSLEDLLSGWTTLTRGV